MCCYDCQTMAERACCVVCVRLTGVVTDSTPWCNPIMRSCAYNTTFDVVQAFTTCKMPFSSNIEQHFEPSSNSVQSDSSQNSRLSLLSHSLNNSLTLAGCTKSSCHGADSFLSTPLDYNACPSQTSSKPSNAKLHNNNTLKSALPILATTTESLWCHIP